MGRSNRQEQKCHKIAGLKSAPVIKRGVLARRHAGPSSTWPLDLVCKYLSGLLQERPKVLRKRVMVQVDLGGPGACHAAHVLEIVDKGWLFFQEKLIYSHSMVAGGLEETS